MKFHVRQRDSLSPSADPFGEGLQKPQPSQLCDIPRRLTSNKRGAVSIIGAFSLMAVIGIAAFSIELGQGYQTKISYQGIADAAALGAANAYTTNPSDSLLNATANAIANANGIATTNVTVTHMTNYSNTVNDAVKVVVTGTIPLFFARILSSATSYTVSVISIASLSSSTVPACIIALSASSTGVSLSAGTRIAAPKCAVASNSTISVAGGSTIVAKATTSSSGTSINGGSSIVADTITYGTSASVGLGSLAIGTKLKKSNSTDDPLATNALLSDAWTKLGTYTTQTVPVVPVGGDLTLGYYPTTMTFQGHVGTLVGNTWLFPAGTYNIHNLNTQSLTLSIPGTSIVTVSSSVTIGGGGKLLIGDGPVSITAPVTLGGGALMMLGAGRHYVGQISVGGGSSVIMGAGDLDVNGAILIDGGGSAMIVGAGNYAIGNNGSGVAINLSGGSSLKFNDGTFSANGAITTSGGSIIVFGATANHLINGGLSLNGSSIFGAGTYTINGNFTNNTGGTMTGSDVTFILAGSLNVAGGTSVNLSAPSGTSSSGITDVLFATRTTAATILGGGTQDYFSGAVYVPNSDFQMSGGASVAGACFMLIAKTVTLSGGPTAGTMCASLTSSSANSSNVTLIQ